MTKEQLIGIMMEYLPKNGAREVRSIDGDHDNTITFTYNSKSPIDIVVSTPGWKRGGYPQNSEDKREWRKVDFTKENI